MLLKLVDWNNSSSINGWVWYMDTLEWVWVSYMVHCCIKSQSIWIIRFNIICFNISYNLCAWVPKHGQWCFKALGWNPAITNKTEISIWTKKRSRIYAWGRIPKLKKDKGNNGRMASQTDAGLTWWWLVAVNLAIRLQQPVAGMGR